MDATAFREELEASKETQLARLGSSKLLLALTDADLNVETVFAVAATSEHVAAETFERWAEDETDDAAREVFEAVAEQEREHERRVTESMDAAFEPPESPGPMHAYLRGLSGTPERVAAGMVGRPLVSVRAHTQLIGFFVNEANPARADLFRDLKAETEGTLERGLELLDEICQTDDDRKRAMAAAAYVVQLAYDEYADSLSGMGVDPKPVC